MPPPDEGLLGFSGAPRAGARKPSDWERQGCFLPKPNIGLII